MDQYNHLDHLNYLFQYLTINPLTEESESQVEELLITILDSNDMEIFYNPLFQNFIHLLDMKEDSSFIILHLLKEIKLKSLRLIYINGPSLTEPCCCTEEEVYDEELPQFDNVILPEPGKRGQINVIEFQDDKKITHVYEVNEKGVTTKKLKTIVETNPEYENGKDVAFLNDSILYKIMQKEKRQAASTLTEDDL